MSDELVTARGQRNPFGFKLHEVRAAAVDRLRNSCCAVTIGDASQRHDIASRSAIDDQVQFAALVAIPKRHEADAEGVICHEFGQNLSRPA